MSLSNLRLKYVIYMYYSPSIPYTTIAKPAQPHLLPEKDSLYEHVCMWLYMYVTISISPKPFLIEILYFLISLNE